MATLTLKPEQDGTGCFYGDYVTDDGDRVRVDVLPPRSHPRPYFVMANEAMHATDWIVYANGQEIARVSRREDLETTIATKLIDSKS